MKWIFIACALIAAAPLACSANKGDATADDLKGRQCSWPSNLDDAGSGGCRAAAAFVQCTYSTGAGCGCLSDNSLICGCEATGATCKDLCAADEYAVSCGGIGPQAETGTPPIGCTFAFANPGGVSYHCCPCQ